LEGFHYFIEDEYACVDEFAWKCISTVDCNSIRPDYDNEITAWELQPLFADYQVADPPVVNCTYTDTEALNIQPFPNYVAGDVICDVRVWTNMSTQVCNMLYEGGIYCNNYNMR